MKQADSDVIPGDVRADGLSGVIVASRFNAAIVKRLVDGALDALIERGARRADFEVLWVGGALELPVVAKAAVSRGDKRAMPVVVCVGCVIKGGTDHYEHVCRAAVDGIMRVSLDSGVPVGNGVLTVATLEQAWERAGGTSTVASVGNKGAEAALATLEAWHRVKRLREGQS